MFGERAAAKLIMLFVGLYTLAMILMKIFANVQPPEEAVGHNKIQAVTVGASSGFATAAERFLGIPICEGSIANSRVPIRHILLASYGALLGAFASVLRIRYDGFEALKVASGTLAGCIGAAAVPDTPLHVLAGAAATGASIRNDNFVANLLLSGVSGTLVSGISLLFSNIIPGFLHHKQSGFKSFSRFAGITVPAVFAGVATALRAVTSDTFSSLGAVGAAAGVTGALALAGHVFTVNFTNAGSPFVASDRKDGANIRKKTYETRRLIAKMTNFEPNERPSASDVTQGVTIIRNFPAWH